MKFKLRRYYLYYLAEIAVRVFGLLPLGVGRAIAARAGALAFLLLPRYRRITIEQLTAVFGAEKSPAEICSLARRVFENLGRTGFEIVKFPSLNADNISRLVDFTGRQRLDEGFRRGKGVIVLTGHFGNWELLAAALRLYGYPGTAIGRRLYFKPYDQLLNRLRKLKTVDIIYRDESPKKVLRALRDNRIVGILADQDVDSVSGVFVNFFGRPAYTPAGPAAIAQASGAALVPTFIVRGTDGRHTIIVEEPLVLASSGNKEADLVANTQAWSDIFERYIRQYPDQWVWLHRRWKTTPETLAQKK